MKTLNYLFLAFMLVSNCLLAQNSNIDKYFLINPTEIKARNTGIQEYDVTLKWQNLDAINGTEINCNGVKATYIIDLENNTVGWKDVSIAKINNFNQKQFQGNNLPSFNDFSYKALDTAFLKEDFYKNIPPEQQDLAKWLVSDAIQMQGLALYVFDSLEFNKEFVPELLNNYDIKFENWVTFSSRYQKLIWSGITKFNNEICAVVKFESLYNPVEIDNKQMSVKGRSLYYGEMWISLDDKQVEYASMIEDVIMKLQSSLFPEDQLIDLQREIIFNKIK
ncbi:MAG: hypothetical protein ABFR32_12370 [Bacteroidota bacterium]